MPTYTQFLERAGRELHQPLRLRLQMQIYCYNPSVFLSLDDAVKGGGRIAAMAVLFEVGRPLQSFTPTGLEIGPAVPSNVISVGRSESSGPVSPQISREDNRNISPVTDAVNTVSRFGECQFLGKESQTIVKCE